MRIGGATWWGYLVELPEQNSHGEGARVFTKKLQRKRMKKIFFQFFKFDYANNNTFFILSTPKLYLQFLSCTRDILSPSLATSFNEYLDFRICCRHIYIF
tara:strand:- start:2218 stop:2517 length:300 start_codon:yes stop_codon:yes gene_type:complete